MHRNSALRKSKIGEYRNMMTVISSLIESGCYSVVFALLLAYALRSSAKREKCYRDVICELANGLKELDTLCGKIDKLLAMSEKAEAEREKKKRKKESVCGCTMPNISETESL